MLLDQITNSGWAYFSVFLTMLFHSQLFIGHVFRFDGDAEDAVLAIHTDNLHLDLFANTQSITRIFNSVLADFLSFENSINFRGHFDDRLLGINFLDLTDNNSAALIDRNIVGERVFFHLLEA